MCSFSCVLWAIWSFPLSVLRQIARYLPHHRSEMPQKLIPNHRTINSKQLLSFIELSAVIGLLLQEGKISLYVNRVHSSGKAAYVSRQEDLYFRFMKLLSEHITSERSISYYASQLCITPKYLSTVVRKVSGKHLRIG